MLETEGSGEGADLAAVTRGRVADDLNLPVVLIVTNSQVTVTGNLLVASRDGGSDIMGVKVAASLSVDQSDNRVVANESEIALGVVVLLAAVGVEEPVVVGVFVVVASNLLLLGTLRVGLDVRVEKTTTVAHVLDGCARTKCDFQRAVLSDLGTLEVGLEKRAHLSVTRATAVEDSEVQGERKEIDQEGNDDKTDDTGDDMGTKGCLAIVSCVSQTSNRNTYNRHLGIAKLSPEVLNSVETDESSHKKTNKLDTADTTNAKTGHEKPEEPLRVEAVITLIVELGPAEHSGDSTTEKHRVEQDESADGCVGVLAENHKGHQPDSRTSELKFASSEVGQRNAENTESRVEDTHDGVVDLWGVLFARLEFEGSVVAGEDSRETNKHLAERRVDIEVVFMLDIVGSELSEAIQRLEESLKMKANRFDVLSFIPGDNVAKTNLVKSGEESQEREDQRGNDNLPSIECLKK